MALPNAGGIEPNEAPPKRELSNDHASIAMRSRIAEVHSDIHHLTCRIDIANNDVLKTQGNLRTMEAALEAQRNDCAHRSQSGEAALGCIRELDRKLESLKAATRTCSDELQELADRQQLAFSGIRQDLDQGFSHAKTELREVEDSLNQAFGKLRAEQRVHVEDVKAWRGTCTAQVEEALEGAKAGNLALATALTIRSEVEENQKRQVVAHEKVRGDVDIELRSMAEKQGRCAAELHRLFTNCEQVVRQERQQLEDLKPEIEALRKGLAAERQFMLETTSALEKRFREVIQSGEQQLKERAQSDRAELEHRIGEVWTYIKEDMAQDRDRREVVLRKEMQTSAERQTASLQATREWALQHIEDSVSKASALIQLDIAKTREDISTTRDRHADLVSTVGALDVSMQERDKAQKEQLEGLREKLTATDARLVAEDKVLASKAAALELALAEAVQKSVAEDEAIRADAATNQEHTKHALQTLRSAIETVSMALATTDTRLTAADASMASQIESLQGWWSKQEKALAEEDRALRERCDELSKRILEVVARQAEAESSNKQRADDLTRDLEGLETRLGEHRTDISNRFEAVQGLLRAEAEARSKEDSSLGAKLEAAGTAIRDMGARQAEENETFQLRLSSFATTMQTIKAEAKQELALQSDRHDALAAQLTKAIERSVSSHESLKRKHEALSINVSEQVVSFKAEQSATTDRFDTLRKAHDHLESKVVKEWRIIHEKTKVLSEDHATLKERHDTNQAQLQSDLQALNTAIASGEVRLRSEDTKLQEQIKELSIAVSGQFASLAGADSRLAEKLELLSQDFVKSERRTQVDISDLRIQTQQKLKEEVTWLLAMVQHSQGNVDRLAYGFKNLGMSHEQCERDFSILEQVVHNVEVKTAPWRAGTGSSDLKAMRCASANRRGGGKVRALSPSRPISAGPRQPRPTRSRCQSAHPGSSYSGQDDGPLLPLEPLASARSPQLVR